MCSSIQPILPFQSFQCDHDHQLKFSTSLSAQFLFVKCSTQAAVVLFSIAISHGCIRPIVDCPRVWLCRLWPWPKPVCGTNGVTYRSECELDKAKCQGNPNLKIDYQGRCLNCEDNNGFCTKELKQVCGTDGWTYPNPCHLNVTICAERKEGRTLGFDHDGECTCADVCMMLHEPVCATDGKTYSNRCFLKQAVCQASKAREVPRFGFDYEGECKESGSPKSTPRQRN